LHVHMHSHEFAGIHTSPSISPSYFFNVCTLIFFWISTCEELSLPTKHEKKLSYQYFWLWRLQSLTHTHTVDTIMFDEVQVDVGTVLFFSRNISSISQSCEQTVHFKMPITFNIQEEQCCCCFCCFKLYVGFYLD
jgi:hypothetical protein